MNGLLSSREMPCDDKTPAERGTNYVNFLIKEKTWDRFE